LHTLLEQEKLKWKQRAKETWLQFGDRNTKFYHACANQKKRRSQIMKIKDKDGRMCNTQEEIEVAFVSYYKELFTVGEELEAEACIGALDRKVTLEMSLKLLTEFSIEEISSTLHQMPPLKAPGLDGFLACFYQTN
jgi:hypothetical protein